MFRVWTLPDGSVEITQYVFKHLMDQDERLQNPAFSHRDFPSREALEAVLPLDRSQRNKWRWIGGQIRPDLTLPDPPHPKQDVLDALDQVTTIASLKATLKQLVLQGRL